MGSREFNQLGPRLLERERIFGSRKIKRMARALEITKGAARSYTVPAGDTAAELRQHGPPVPLQLRRLSATHPLVARARGKDEFDDKDSTDRATLCDCAAVRHERAAARGAGATAGQAASSQSAAPLPGSSGTGVCQLCSLGNHHKRFREDDDAKPQHVTVKVLGQGTRQNTKRAGAAKWVSKLCGSAGSLRVSELPGCAKGQENDYHGSVSRFKLGLTRRSYTRARRPISFSITSTIHEQRSAKRPPSNS